MSDLSKMKRADIHARCSGPYPSQSTRYCSPRPHRRHSMSRLTVNVSPPPMTRGGMGPTGAEASAWVSAGFTLETWNVGWMRCIVEGSLRRTAVGPMTWVMVNGPTYRGTSFPGWGCPWWRATHAGQPGRWEQASASCQPAPSSWQPLSPGRCVWPSMSACTAGRVPPPTRLPPPPPG